MASLRFLESRLLLVGATVGALTFLGSYCDRAADECDTNPQVSSYCTAENVAVSCYKPGEESHAREARTACGSDRLCVLDRDHVALCARGASAACPESEEASHDAGVAWLGSRATICGDAGPSTASTVKSLCVATLDGGVLCNDTECTETWWRSACSSA